MKSHSILLLFIVGIAAFLRLFNLSVNPPSLTWDEVAWGYNAYSLGIDGRDEFGRFLPLDYLESFGDFKPPVYAYLDILPVKIFGLNEFAVRFPSAFFGTLTVLITYLLIQRMFTISGERSLNPKLLALTGALFLAISPWHINLSRAAFEANVATFFIVSGVFFFLKAVQGRKHHLIFSAIFFVLSLYTFNTSRVFVPLLLLFLAIGYRKELLDKKKELIIASVIGFLLLLPTLNFLFSPQASLRFKEVNIFSDISVIQRTNQEIENDKNSVWSKALHNRRLTYGVEYLRHYFDNLNPLFLFIKGDGNPKFSTQDIGQLYLWDLPFFIIGILFLFRFRQGAWWVVPGWILLGLIPAGLARETPHALRIETIIPTFQIITAYGLVYVINKLSTRPIKFFIFPLFFLFLFFNVLYYLHGYYIHYPQQYSGEWQYGYKESIEYVQSMDHQYDEFYITSELGRPYVYYLFYLKIHPSIFRNSAKVQRDVFGFVDVGKFGKYHFAKSLNPKKTDKNVLYIDTPGNIPSGAHVVREFNLLNGKTTLIAYDL